MAESVTDTKSPQASASKPAVKITKTTGDPDLKLSIEELRKKYPINLLDQKKKSYKQGQKINLDDYSIEEIKAAFLNADRNFISRIPLKDIPIINGKYDHEILYNDVKAYSQLELDIIDESCNKLGLYVFTKPKKYQILQYFLFHSEKIQIFIGRFIPTKTSICFSNNDPFELEDRN